MVRPSVSPATVDSLTNHTHHSTIYFVPSHPIPIYPAFRVGVPELAAAVSNAGGLGILTALTQPNPNALREAIRKTRKLTDKNFGVNITLLPSINPPDYEGYARAAVEEGVTVFETAGNNREFSLRFGFPRLVGTEVLMVEQLARSSSSSSRTDA